MAKHVYRFTGESPETFLDLPADPPSRELKSGDEVVCSAEIVHPRLQPTETKPAAAPSNPKKED